MRYKARSLRSCTHTVNSINIFNVRAASTGRPSAAAAAAAATTAMLIAGIIIVIIIIIIIITLAIVVIITARRHVRSCTRSSPTPLVVLIFSLVPAAVSMGIACAPTHNKQAWKHALNAAEQVLGRSNQA